MTKVPEGELSALPIPLTLLVNGYSRRGATDFSRASQVIHNAGIPVGDTILARSQDETRRVLEREIQKGAKTVIIGGGDGTLSLCANVLVNTPVAMGVLPLGTGNTFVRSLGIPVQLEAAAQTIAAGHVEAIDVGRVNGRIFLNSVSLGLSASIVSALDRETKRRWGRFSWIVTGPPILLQHRALVLKITSPTETFHARTHQLLVSNGRYVSGPIIAAPDASVQDGQLRVFVLGGSRLSSLMRASWEWLTGQRLHSSRSRYFTTTHLKVESVRRRVRADVDGELIENTPLTLEIMPRALHVIVPRGFRAKAV